MKSSAIGGDDFHDRLEEIAKGEAQSAKQNQFKLQNAKCKKIFKPFAN